MSFKDVLLNLTSYPEPPPNMAITDAIGLAQALGAQLSAIMMKVRFQATANLLGNVFLNISGMMATEAKKSADNADALALAFRENAEKAGVLQDVIVEECHTSGVPDRLAGHARVRDLTILPLPDGEHIDQWYAEAVIFESGRPVIVLPHSSGRADPLDLSSVVVAWDYSKPAARAIADAMPLLRKARHVCVVTVVNEKAMRTDSSGRDLARYLSRHGIEAVLDNVNAAGRSVADVLSAYTASNRADLLVMGAYGHSRVREFILGGATYDILAKPPLPVLFSH